MPKAKHIVHARRKTKQIVRTNFSVKGTNQRFLSETRVTYNKPKNHAQTGSSKISAMNSRLTFLTTSAGLRILTTLTERTFTPPTVLSTSPDKFEITVSTKPTHESKTNPSETLPDSAFRVSSATHSNGGDNTENVLHTEWMGGSQFWSKWDTDKLNRTQRRAQLEKYCDSLRQIPINCNAQGNTVCTPEDSVIQQEWRRIDKELRNVKRFGNPLAEALSRLAKRRTFPRSPLSSKYVYENPTEVRKYSNVTLWLNMVHQIFAGAQVVPPEYLASTLRPNAGNSSSFLARVEKKDNLHQIKRQLWDKNIGPVPERFKTQGSQKDNPMSSD